MGARGIWLGPLLLAVGLSTAYAGPHSAGSGGGGGGGGVCPPGGSHHHGSVSHSGLFAVGGGWAWYGWYRPPVIVVAPPPLTPAFDRGALLAGPMPADRMRGIQAQPPARAKRPDPARSAQLVTLGDRLFRAGNTRKAEERYEQAVRADPNAAAPHVRLAQLALVRGQYGEAANQLRDAQTAEPTWLIRATDVQALFAEPTDFARHIAKLESHLQANPNDRDAWLVLGAEWFLSGRTRKAADVFVRLSDRQPDPLLSALLDAATPREAQREQ